ncbi:hypothetical protein SAMN05444141_106427 [Pseudovibrio denitrificans]|uniref:Capsule polysaccharide biosynthesis protein n=1 Tax=Pseudovibrio denitrificans TaxID=258256 RepID=A0A1I7CTX4_9HYPH|nr:hypothetical protein [Pseudovibrio denitrificans]SFU02872.1 hypothetical protein SAMN05444141_106427 [Pseudovibrio denitrificans]
MDVSKSKAGFKNFLKSADLYWGRTSAEKKVDAGYIICDLFHHDPRLAMRGLTISKAIQQKWGCGIKCLVGTTDLWRDVVLVEYDLQSAQEMARSFHVNECIDVLSNSRTGNFRLTNEQRQMISDLRAGRVQDVEKLFFVDGFNIGHHISTTYQRLHKTPSLSYKHYVEDKFLSLVRETFDLYNSYYDLVASGKVKCFVTSHTDYNIWGILADLCIQNDIPVFHYHSTTDVKIFSYFPESFDVEKTFRENYAINSGRYFKENIAPYMDYWKDGIERVLYSNKMDFSRPSWWLNGRIRLSSTNEKAYLRKVGLDYFNWDDSKPVYVLFLHSLTDALYNNFEIYHGYKEWVEETLKIAQSMPHVNWVIRNHPASPAYDSTDQFEIWAEQYQSHNIAFSRAREFDKSMLWSICDLAITVRGSISNELPSYGFPIIQAGHSEMSHCGFSRVALTKEHYREMLEAGPFVVTEEEVKLARLWMYTYRNLTHVKSPIIPTYSLGKTDTLFYISRMNMSVYQVEDDDVFRHVATMIERRDPALYRYDLLDEAKAAKNRDLERYVVSHPLSTQYCEPMRQTNLDLTVSCTSKASDASFELEAVSSFFDGFSRAHEWGRWTTKKHASAMFILGEEITSDLELAIVAKAMVFSSEKAGVILPGAEHARILHLPIDVCVNGRKLQTIHFHGDHEGDKFRTYRMIVPKEILENERCIFVSFKIPIEGRTLKSMGDPRQDTRELGLGLQGFSISKVNALPDHKVIGEDVLFDSAVGMNQVQGFAEPSRNRRWTDSLTPSACVFYKDLSRDNGDKLLKITSSSTYLFPPAKGEERVRDWSRKLVALGDGMYRKIIKKKKRKRNVTALPSYMDVDVFVENQKIGSLSYNYQDDANNTVTKMLPIPSNIKFDTNFADIKFRLSSSGNSAIFPSSKHKVDDLRIAISSICIDRDHIV